MTPPRSRSFGLMAMAVTLAVIVAILSLVFSLLNQAALLKSRQRAHGDIINTICSVLSLINSPGVLRLEHQIPCPATYKKAGASQTTFGPAPWAVPIAPKSSSGAQSDVGTPVILPRHSVPPMVVPPRQSVPPVVVLPTAVAPLPRSGQTIIVVPPKPVPGAVPAPVPSFICIGKICL